MKNALTLQDKILAALRGEESEVEIYWDAQDSAKQGPAYRIDSGESGALDFYGWETLDGSEQDTQGYYLTAYFDMRGEYSGPDQDGVYPHLEA